MVRIGESYTNRLVDEEHVGVLVPRVRVVRCAAIAFELAGSKFGE